MAIPSVMRGLIETEDGKVFELDSAKGAAWLETIGSFRYEPTGDGKPYTVRKEGKNGEYWYGCRKIEGKVRKKYIGKSSEVSVAKLEEIAEALEIPAEPRVNKVAEVAQQVVEVAQSPQVVETVAESRVTALELQVAELLKAVKDIQEALPGKCDAGDSLELPKVDNEVVERLQNELSNLKAENELLKQVDHALTTPEEARQHSAIYGFTPEEALADAHFQIAMLQSNHDELEDRHEAVKREYAALLESSTAVTNRLREEVREVRSQLAAEETRFKELDEECDDRDKVIAELRSEVADLKQKSASASEPPEKTLPDALTILNYLRGKRKKSAVTLDDVKAMLEVINKS